MQNSTKEVQTIQSKLFSYLIKARYSFTGIGSAVGILTLFVFYGMGVLPEPNVIVWASAFVVGGGVGLLVDEIQNRLSN